MTSTNWCNVPIGLNLISPSSQQQQMIDQIKYWDWKKSRSKLPLSFFYSGKNCGKRNHDDYRAIVHFGEFFSWFSKTWIEISCYPVQCFATNHQILRFYICILVMVTYFYSCCLQKSSKAKVWRKALFNTTFLQPIFWWIQNSSIWVSIPPLILSPNIFVFTSFVDKVLGVSRGWTFTIIILGAYSKVILLVLLSNFAQCMLPCARLNPVARIPWAPSTAQNLKVTLIEWLLNMHLMMIVKVHRLCIFAMNAKI